MVDLISAIIVVVNSILQIILYAPMAVFFINIISGEKAFSVSYGTVAIDVLIVRGQYVLQRAGRMSSIYVSERNTHTSMASLGQYLGIPLAAGVVTRYTVWGLTSKSFLYTRFLPLFGPVALLGLLYTIFVLFAYQGESASAEHVWIACLPAVSSPAPLLTRTVRYQGNNIVHNLGPVFRTFVPMVVYFTIMWTSAFAFIYYLTRWRMQEFGYEMAVVQSFTAGPSIRPLPRD